MRDLRSMPRPVEALPCGSRSMISDALADRGQRGAEIDRRRRLADAALLVGEHENARQDSRLGLGGFVDGRQDVASWTGLRTAARPEESRASGSSLLAKMSIVRSGAAGRASSCVSAERPRGKTPTAPCMIHTLANSTSRGKGAKARAMTASTGSRRSGRSPRSRSAWIVAGAPVARATSRKNAHLRRSLSMQMDARAGDVGEQDRDDHAGKAGAGAEIDPAPRARARAAGAGPESAMWRVQTSAKVASEMRLVTFRQRASRST